MPNLVFTMRCYASMVYAIVMCPSIRLCVRHKPILYFFLNTTFSQNFTHFVLGRSFNINVWISSVNTHTHTHPFNGCFSGTTRVSRYQKGNTNLDFTEARDSEWQWHQLGHMQVCTSLQTDNHASTAPLSFLQAGCSSCRPTNSVKALKGKFLQ